MPKVFKFLFFWFLTIGFLFIFLNYCHAAELEINYPAIHGETITSQTSVPAYLKYIFDLSMFVGFFAVFLSLVYAGILYFLSPVIPNALASAKDRVGGAVSGLLILALLYLIITTINPALAFFKVTTLTKISTPPPPPPPAGVYLYKSSDCTPDTSTYIRTSSAVDLQDSRGNVRSASITQDDANGIYYGAILYSSLNLHGKCQLLDPTNLKCNSDIEPFASSVSIFKYSSYPSGNVTFYRNPFFGDAGGYRVLTSSDVKKLYISKLENLRFIDLSAKSNDNSDGCTVPKEEQDCTQWDKQGTCTKRECPKLSAENIGSVQISGNYLVLLVYFGPQDNSYGPWTYCQAFSTTEDINKMGPLQIKWEEIKNLNGGKIPNWVVIIPVDK